MYLSRIQINPARRGGQKLLGSPQAMHAAVLSSFMGDADNRGRVLWRVDRDEHKTWLYVTSSPRPDFSHIVEQAGWSTTQVEEGSTQSGWDVRGYENLLGSLAAGQTWGFRVTANPTRSTRRGGSQTGATPSGIQTAKSQRYGHVTVDQQLEWFTQRTTGWGFSVAERDSVLDVTVHDRRTERFRRGGQTVTIAKATFDGVLTVSDADALRQALVGGMGPAKGYGCGLLTLAPVG
ncbi:type I-E CRISPR-associated protein Cas6/Cse3/CasE [Oerskovia enterophila]|uniref:type I-E CRISPR-associated protein Cas6/Cse3/CasE n=1 Tax=Oerskovia enterophila TaxID=43678 RepID=UPI0033915ABA